MPSTATDRLAGASASVAVKAPCRVATTVPVVLSGEQTIDGVAVAAGERVLVKNQSTASQNGIWVVSASVWSRAKDFDGARDVVKGTLVPVTDGTANAGFIFKVTTLNPIVVGTTNLAFQASTFTDIAVSSFWQDVLDESSSQTAVAALGAEKAFAKGNDIVSASPLVLGADGNYFDVTEANAITSISAAAGRFFILRFASTPTLTHHATNLNLPGGTNITAAAGDRLIGFATATNQVTVIDYIRAAKLPMLQGKHQINLPAAAFIPQSTTGCAALAVDESTTHKAMTAFLAFDSAAIEYAQTSFKSPISADEGTFSAVVVWKELSGATAHVVVWTIQMQAQGDGDTIDSAWGAGIDITDTGSSGTRRISPESTAITPAGTWAAGDEIMVRLSRKATDGSDTLDVDAHVIEMALFVNYNAGNEA